MKFFLAVCLSFFILISGVACVSVDRKPADKKTVDSKAADMKPADCSIEVTDMLPDGFADTTRPVISATLLSKCGNDIDIGSIELLINDEAVPVEVNGSGSKVSVKHALKWSLAQSSDHYVTVRAKDKEGNAVEKEWAFWLGLIY